MCEVTGGKLFVANSKQALHQVLESLNSKIHPGVVITLEPLPGLRAGQSQMPSAQHKMILTKPQQKGHWPIPDEFWPNTLEHQIPARNVRWTPCFGASHVLLGSRSPPHTHAV